MFVKIPWNLFGWSLCTNQSKDEVNPWKQAKYRLYQNLSQVRIERGCDIKGRAVWSAHDNWYLAWWMKVKYFYNIFE